MSFQLHPVVQNLSLHLQCSPHSGSTTQTRALAVPLHKHPPHPKPHLSTNQRNSTRPPKTPFNHLSILWSATIQKSKIITKPSMWLCTAVYLANKAFDHRNRRVSCHCTHRWSSTGWEQSRPTDLLEKGSWWRWLCPDQEPVSFYISTPRPRLPCMEACNQRSLGN